MYGRSFLEPIPGSEDTAARLCGEVEVLAGAAADGFTAAGIAIDWKPPGTFSTTSVNPALVWSAALEPDPLVHVGIDAIDSCCRRAIGRLEGLLEEQEERERGFAGVLGRFLSFPTRVREAAGLPASSMRGRAAAGFAVFLQSVAVAITGGLVVALVIYLLGWAA